mmetsp:Transcript_18221/g.27336  ORF Transcript_18221/g.27336 Transcript_18221/m.27336 type:complete len:120 (+) Transcript_18221:34-393(+)
MSSSSIGRLALRPAMRSALLRAGLRPTLRRNGVRVRTMVGGHGSPEEIKAGMEWWKKATMLSIPFVGIALLANVYLEATHHAHDEGEGPVYSFLKIRNKPYPWGKGDCNFFDLKCRRNE